MKARPREIAEAWHKAECDPDGKVEYLIRPMTTRIQLYLGGKHTTSKVEDNGEPKVEVDTMGMGFELVRFALRGLRGLEDTDGTDFTLEFEQVNVIGGDEQVVTLACFDRLPVELVLEIIAKLGEGVEAGGGEAVDFSVGSSTKGTRRARAKKKRARTTARKAGSKSKGKG